MTHCSVSGQPIAQHITGGGCPKGKHPDAGMVKSGGVYHYGVPMLSRLFVWVFHPNHPKPKSFGGCGCIAPLKDLYTRARLVFANNGA